MSRQLNKIKFDRKGRYVLGKKLGEGAQGSVYSLIKEDGSDSDWCTKITPIAKPTKTRRTVDEVNERALNHERLMYQSSFVRLQGDMIPKLPKDSGDTKYLIPYNNDKDAGYLFLVMERMQMSLMDAVKLLPVKNNAVDLTDVAQRLLCIFKKFHGSYKLITDVKSDNFMVARGEGSVAERMRMVDLALLRDMMNEYGKHAANEQASSMRGTPLYASLNVHELQSPSRRDDIESLVFMLAEMVIAVRAAHTEPKPEWYKTESFLPWSNGKSDDDIFEQKKKNLEDRSSELYSRMPPNLVPLFQEMWNECRRCQYKDEPNYDFFLNSFKKLIVCLPDNKRKAAARSPIRSPNTRRKTESRAHIPVESDESPGDPMEVDEEWSAENTDPHDSILSHGFKEDRKYEAATITAVKGPHMGEKWVVQEGDQEQYCIGSNPTKKSHLSITLSKDKSILSNHARIKLALNKRKLLIQIWDLSKGKTKINGSVKSSPDFAIFHGDKIEMGDTVLQVSRAPRPSSK